jgi:putative oxidoreductase
MLVAMASTKIPLYLGTSPLPLPPVPPQIGFWAVLHEIRSEFAQLLNCAFLLLVGPGAWSIDALLARRPVLTSSKHGTLSSLPQEHSMQ